MFCDTKCARLECRGPATVFLNLLVTQGISSELKVNTNKYLDDPPTEDEDSLPDWAAMSVPKFCKYSSLSKASAYRAMQAGLLHAVKCNGRTLISVAEAKAFLSRLQKKGGAM